MGAMDRDDPADVFDAVEEMSAERKEVFLAEVKAITSALRKGRILSHAVIGTFNSIRYLRALQIRTIANKIVNSSTILLPRWKQLVAELGLPPKVLPRDVSTRWNSTYDMLVMAIQYKRTVRDITSEDTLLQFALTSTEWTILDQLREVLKVCYYFYSLFYDLRVGQALKDATLYFSHSDANLALVIPAMDKLGKMFRTATIVKSKTDQLKLCNPLKAALLVAKDTLDKYYLLSDASEIYRLAISRFPALLAQLPLTCF